MTSSLVQLQATSAAAGQRLDRYLAEQLSDYSRSRIQAWIRDGRVEVDGETAPSSLKLQGGEKIAVDPAPLEPLKAKAENIPLDILFEDEHVIAVNKDAGMTVHAGAGDEARSGTLVNALLHRFEQLSTVGGDLRPGIVHRLDRLTSGVLLVAKTDQAHRALAEQFEQRVVKKTYLALVHGNVPDPARNPPKKGRVVKPGKDVWVRLETLLGRDPNRRHRQAITQDGKEAVTDYRPLGASDRASLLEVRIHTGRTHQIRVHLSSVGRPIIGDVLYGAPADPAQSRFFLHAWKLACRHPVSGDPLELEAPPPPEFKALAADLRL